ncbi:hypothetical protein DSO57_1010667 [Entomophthora muscae]|uniref:Uncharacterized protein n=1 Tax=Entomophthora muscae TaxID=34485 RepID=A0ACC2TU93_9FUNG|nr:hypothetical protein DSO57_1010667 [Entomophthora muscae]
MYFFVNSLLCVYATPQNMTISNKRIAVKLPPPKAFDVLSELTLTCELKQLPSGKQFLVYNDEPAVKNFIICYATQRNLMS